MKPLVSIIIPCYNAEKWVAEAIQSALAQTWPNKEVIVIDDGSTDGSLGVIKNFGDRIRWETGPNRGGCDARNRGLGLAQGELIQFHDADDVMVNTCIEDKLNTPCSKDEIACGDAALMTNPTVPAWGGENGYYSLNYALRYSAPRTDAPIHRKSMLSAIGGFRSAIPCAQDYDLHMRLMTRFHVKFKSNNKIGVLVRPLENSVSRSAGIKLPLTVFQILENAICDLEASAPLDVEQRRNVSEHFAKIARTLWRYGSSQKSLEVLRKSRSYSRYAYLRAYNSNLGRLLVLLLGFKHFELLHAFAYRGK